MFSALSKASLAKALILKETPIYVQFYITARCNLTCQQCNIIYANSDVRECTLPEIERIADHFAELGVAIVLLTGGEPFSRRDLPEIIRAFESRGVHVRMQTNGLAGEEQIHAAIEAGGKDISISLDSLWPSRQDLINGGFTKSWEKALKTAACFTKYLPREGSFASFGCVLQPDNTGDIEDVIRFGTQIGWYTSLVPIHTSDYNHPRGFRTFDRSLAFRPDEYPTVDKVIERVRAMRKEGYLLYDSDQYLDDILRFVRREPITWRNRHGGVCDSPNLYFAVLPNGELAPCCDHRLPKALPVFEPDFPRRYRDKAWRASVREITSACKGCMYGSYPEITISMRYAAATLQRVGTFMTSPPKKPWPLGAEAIIHTAEKIRSEQRERPHLRGQERKGQNHG